MSDLDRYYNTGFDYDKAARTLADQRGLDFDQLHPAEQEGLMWSVDLILCAGFHQRPVRVADPIGEES